MKHVQTTYIAIYVLRRLVTWDKKYSAKHIFCGVLPYLTLLQSKGHSVLVKC